MWKLLGSMIALAGCAGEQITASNPCVIGGQPFSDDGSETPLQMRVAKDADKCVIFVAKIMGEPGSVKGIIINEPRHGTAEGFSEPTGLVVRGVQMSVGMSIPNAQQLAVGASYRPARSYVGNDEFRFSMAPVRRGTFRVQVQVVEPATLK